MNGAIEEVDKQIANLVGSHAVLVVQVDQEDRPADLKGYGYVGQVIVGLKPDGTTIVGNPSPMTGKTEKTKLKILMGLLESKALRGSMDATRAWLQQFKWNEEMKRGKAPQRVGLHVSGVVTVVDDLTSQLPSAHDDTPIAVARVGEKEKVAPPRPQPVGVHRARTLPAGVGKPVVVDVEAKGQGEESVQSDDGL